MTTPGSARQRQRVSLHSMLNSSSLPAWRERLERSEGSRSARGSAAASGGSSSGGSGARAYEHTGPALTLEQMRTPAKEGGAQGHAAIQRSHAHPAHQHQQQQAQYASAEGAYQYDLYPSSSHQQHQQQQQTRAAPFLGSRESAAAAAQSQSLFYPVDAASSLSHSLSSTRLASSMDGSGPRSHYAYASPAAARADPPALDIPATQKRIRSLMDEQNQRSVQALSASSHATMQRQHEQEQKRRAAAAAAPQYPHTAAAAAARGARTVAEMKRDVAFQVMDRSHPSHPLNNPRDAAPAVASFDSGGSFHLAGHSRRALAEAPPAPSARLGAGYAHPLGGDARGDRRVHSILSTAHPASLALTQNQLRANAVPLSSTAAAGGAGLAEEKEPLPPPRPALSFFPVDTPSSTAASEPAKPQQRQAKSAYLATMQAGALRVEHMLRQPKVQAMLDLVLPATLSREQVLAQAPSPPRRDQNGSNVDQLLYDTITGKEERRRMREKGREGALARVGGDAHDGEAYAFAAPSVPGATMRSSPGASASASAHLSPPSTSFSRASLLHREARLDALIALSSPGADDQAPLLRVTYDPLAAERAATEAAAAEAAAPAPYFDTGLLGDRSALHSGTHSRTLLADEPRRGMFGQDHLDAEPRHTTSNVEVVLEELLGPEHAARARAETEQLQRQYQLRHRDAAGNHDAPAEGEVEETVLERTRLAGAASAGAGEFAADSPLSATASFAASASPAYSEGFSRASERSDFEHFARSSYVRDASAAAALGSAEGIRSVSGGGGVVDSEGLLSLSAGQLEYLADSTSVSTDFLRSELSAAYQGALEAKAEQLCFVRGRHDARRIFAGWRRALAAAQERQRVLLHQERHRGDAGYRHYLAQQRQGVEEARRDLTSPSSAAPVPAPATATAQAPAPEASALLSSPPSLPHSSSHISLARKTLVAETCDSASRDLVATIHADQSRARRSFLAWARWSRVERIGHRSAQRAQEVQKRVLFKNWRDLMRIVRGEFHMWAAGKQSDALQLQLQGEQEQGRREATRQEDAAPYARASPDPSGRGFAPRAPSPLRSPARAVHGGPIREAVAASPCGRAMSPSARFSSSPVGTSASPISSPRGTLSSSPTAPLAAHLVSAATRESFSAHQDAIHRSRREEEELRQHFAALRAKHVRAERGGGSGSGGAAEASPRAGMAGPLLFQLGSSIQRPSFVVDAQPKPVATAGSQHRYAPGPGPEPAVRQRSPEAPLHVSLEPFRLTSPIRTGSGAVLHQATGSPSLDAALLRGDERAEVPARRGSSASPKASPLRPPSFLTRRKGDRRDDSPSSSPAQRGVDRGSEGEVEGEEGDGANSPVRAHVVSNTASFRASPSPASSAAAPSATTHGYLPLDLAPAAASAGRASPGAYYDSSHWVPPPPSSVSNEELLANVRIAAETRAAQAALKEQNQLAQWRRIELEKQHYRNRVQEQHMHAQPS